MAWGWGKDPITGFINTAGSAVADVGYNTFTGSWGGDDDWSATSNAWDTYMHPNRSNSSPTPTYNPPDKPDKTWSAGDDDFNATMAAYDRQLAYLQAQLAAQPRFIDYNIEKSWDKARKMATKAVSPIYQQKMSDFIDRQQTELTREKTDVTSQKSQLDQALGRLIEDINTQRGRTREDTEGNIADIQARRGYESRAEGLDFDARNRQLNESLGAGNMAQSGLGQQQVQGSQMARRMQSNEQIRQSSNKVEAQNTLMNRTFEDLMTKESRNRSDTKQSKQKLDVNLERFIEDQSYKKDQQFKQWKLQKAADISQKSLGLQDQLVDQWLATLSGKGYTAEEIANAASIYG